MSSGVMRYSAISTARPQASVWVALIAGVRVGFRSVISFIALVAAGIGIMNIMLVSVTERTKEIGVRKSIGARSRDILQQFLTEAVFISEAGGILGIILGVIGGDLLAVSDEVDDLAAFGRVNGLRWGGGVRRLLERGSCHLTRIWRYRTFAL